MPNIKFSVLNFLIKFNLKLINYRHEHGAYFIFKRNRTEIPLEHNSSINCVTHIQFCSLPEVGYKFLVAEGYILLITPINSNDLPAHAVQGIPG